MNEVSNDSVFIAFVCKKVTKQLVGRFDLPSCGIQNMTGLTHHCCDVTNGTFAFDGLSPLLSLLLVSKMDRAQCFT